MNYTTEKNAFEVIAHILDFMIDSINEQMNKSDGSDTKILAEVFQDIVEMSLILYYVMTRTPQFFDVIELYNNTAFFSILNTECINQLDQLIQTLLNPNDQGLRGLESFLPWKCLIEGLRYRSEIIRKIFNQNSPGELFKSETDFSLTDVEFIKWLSYGNYNYLPPDFMYENNITSHSDAGIYDTYDKEMLCGENSIQETLQQSSCTNCIKRLGI